ncbi:MAG: hypothetical protein ACKVOM_00285 [Ferruginibacter sp.]
MKKLLPILSLLLCANAFTQKENLQAKVINDAAKIEQEVINWRRDFHPDPELGNTADFFLDESSFKLGVNAFTNLILDFMVINKTSK